MPALLILERTQLLHFSGQSSKKEFSFEDRLENFKAISNEALRRIFKESGGIAGLYRTKLKQPLVSNSILKLVKLPYLGADKKVVGIDEPSEPKVRKTFRSYENQEVNISGMVL